MPDLDTDLLSAVLRWLERRHGPRVALGRDLGPVAEALAAVEGRWRQLPEVPREVLREGERRAA